MGEDPKAWTTWRKGSAGNLTGDQLLDAAKTGRIWLNLRQTNDHVPEYAALSDEIFAEKEAHVPGLKTFKRDLGMLISSRPTPRSSTISTCRWCRCGSCAGRRRSGSIRSPTLCRRLATGEDRAQGDRRAVRLPARDGTRARGVDLTPGKMVTWKQNAPHRIENGPMLNVSLSIEFMTPPALMRANVIYANGV
jgi:hypothetical protein